MKHLLKLIIVVLGLTTLNAIAHNYDHRDYEHGYQHNYHRHYHEYEPYRVNTYVIATRNGLARNYFTYGYELRRAEKLAAHRYKSHLKEKRKKHSHYRYHHH